MDKNFFFVYSFVMASPSYTCPVRSYYKPDTQILIMMRRILHQWHYDTHNPPYWRLYWNSSPGAVIIHQNSPIALTPKQFVLIPPNTVITQRLRRAPVTHFYVHFFTNAPFNRLHSKVYAFAADLELTAPIKKIPADTNNDFTNDMPATMMAYGLVHGLLSKIPAADINPFLAISPKIEQSLTFLETRLTGSFSNEETARQSGMSVSTLLRKFKTEMGISPHEYLRRKRIEKACALLHNLKMSLDQIAMESGFCDRYHLSKTIKTFTGQSPARFRHGIKMPAIRTGACLQPESVVEGASYKCRIFN